MTLEYKVRIREPYSGLEQDLIIRIELDQHGQIERVQLIDQYGDVHEAKAKWFND